MTTPFIGSVRISRLIPGSKIVIFKDYSYIFYVEQHEVFSKAILDFLTELRLWLSKSSTNYE